MLTGTEPGDPQAQRVERVARMAREYRAQRAALAFLDSNLWLGRPAVPGFRRQWDRESLLGSMERFAIRGGIASHNAAIGEDPYTANEEMMAQVEGQPRLWAGLVLVPELSAGWSGWDAYLDAAIARGARLVRLFPGSHRFSLDPWCSGDLLEAVHRRRLPVALWHIEAGWGAIRALCERYPEMPVIVEGRPQKILYHNRHFYPMLERYQNLSIELHNFNVYLGVEDICARFGAGRLIFGSCLPFNDPNTAQMMVTAARIDERSKALISHGNLEALLEGVRQP